MQFSANPKIVVVGLGYVGLPLAVALAEHFDTIGLDIDEERISELRQGVDRTNELTRERLERTRLSFTSEAEAAASADLYIVTVPTPVNDKNEPDLSPVISATRAVARMIDPDRPTVIVYESTVYPGVTEDVCGPILEKESGLQRGTHFWLGYSPERINPGDREHTVDRIAKVIAGENQAVTDHLAQVYGAITTAGVFPAASIKVAEAAKVIENAQRDINIAFMNEVAQIFAKVGISVWDVLAAAGTKWNFLKFQPGLVGGHCIGVDPYYLSHLAQRLGHEPNVILSGRAINDQMGEWIVGELTKDLPHGGRALVLGITFKENVPDIRNSKVIDVVRGLAAKGFDVTVHDPVADSAEVQDEYGISLRNDALEETFDMVIGAVPHDFYRDLPMERLASLVREEGLLADLKGMWKGQSVPPGLHYWSL